MLCAEEVGLGEGQETQEHLRAACKWREVVAVNPATLGLPGIAPSPQLALSKTASCSLCTGLVFPAKEDPE